MVNPDFELVRVNAKRLPFSSQRTYRGTFRINGRERSFEFKEAASIPAIQAIEDYFKREHGLDFEITDYETF